MNSKLRFISLCLLFLGCKKENEPLTVDCRLNGLTYPMKYSVGFNQDKNLFYLHMTYIGSIPEYDINASISNLPCKPGKINLTRDKKGPSVYFEVVNGDYPIDDYELLPAPDSSYFEVEQTTVDHTSVTGNFRLKLVWYPLYGPKGGTFPDTILLECPTSNFLFE